MSASLDFGIEYRPITAPNQTGIWLGKKRKKENRKRRIIQFFQDFPNCYYCGTQLTQANRSLDHWVPKSLGGTSRFVNLVTSCKDCNGVKGSKLPSGMVVVPNELTTEWYKLKLKVREARTTASLTKVGHARAWKLFPCY